VPSRCPPDGACPDSDFPADPYPGAVPPFSFVHHDGRSWPLVPGAGWHVGAPDGPELDLWLAGFGAPPLAARVPVLSYGSNRNPNKITWLRGALGLPGPVVVLRARTRGIAAVWASGFRARDGQRTSVLGAAPGAVEQHGLWLATPEQVAVLDRCEGRGDRYRLARLGVGSVHVDDGTRIDAPWCYVGLSARRRPLLVDGRPVRCADVGQAAAVRLTGEPASDDGLDAVTVDGSPEPRRLARGRVHLRHLAARPARVALARRTRRRPPAPRHDVWSGPGHRPRLPRVAPPRRGNGSGVGRTGARSGGTAGQTRRLRGPAVPPHPCGLHDGGGLRHCLLDLRLDLRR
jgi:hypothetical protein